MGAPKLRGRTTEVEPTAPRFASHRDWALAGGGRRWGCPSPGKRRVSCIGYAAAHVPFDGRVIVESDVSCTPPTNTPPTGSASGQPVGHSPRCSCPRDPHCPERASPPLATRTRLPFLPIPQPQPFARSCSTSSSARELVRRSLSGLRRYRNEHEPFAPEQRKVRPSPSKATATAQLRTGTSQAHRTCSAHPSEPGTPPNAKPAVGQERVDSSSPARNPTQRPSAQQPQRLVVAGSATAGPAAAPNWYLNPRLSGSPSLSRSFNAASRSTRLPISDG
jgi:hypothetical protein